MSIRVGIGGWTFPPWRNNFYPQGLVQTKELEFASRHVTSIEVNATLYRNQTPDSFRRWAQQTPDDFVFALKAHRVTTHRNRLADSGPSIESFLTSGILELGKKLGPILWQFAPTKRFEPEDFEAFLAALPHEREGQSLRHVVEVRHESFRDPAFIALLRRHQTALCVAQSDTYPQIADVTADFVYARLQCSRESIAAGYAPDDLDAWAERARLWSAGKVPKDLALAATSPSGTTRQRDCFIYFISGAKERNPAAAMSLIARLEPERI